MFFLTKPHPDTIRAFLSTQRNEPFSYSQVGASRGQPPDGYTVDRNRIRLGQGPDVFDRAVNAIHQWKMFDMPWVHLCWPDTPLREGATVAVLVSHLGFWSLSACRIVYVIEENGSPRKFGFAYGTLPDHAERGEERFSVEFHPEDQSVWYDLYAFSRPTLSARLAYPFTTALQKRFARDSKRAMQRAVANSSF